MIITVEVLGFSTTLINCAKIIVMLASHALLLYLIAHQHLMITHLKHQINYDQVWAKFRIEKILLSIHESEF